MTGVAEKLDHIRAKGAIRSVDVAGLIGTRPETVSRWRRGRAHPHAGAERTLLGLEYIIDQLGDVYEPSAARLWMFSPQRLLDGKAPADLIRAGRIDEVKRLIGQIREGVYL